jgi:hypothetical protein
MDHFACAQIEVIMLLLFSPLDQPQKPAIVSIGNSALKAKAAHNPPDIAT